ESFFIPTTISPEAQAFLQSTFARSTRDARAWPDSTDPAAWRAVWEEREADRRPLCEQVIAHLHPTIAALSLDGVPALEIRPRTWRNDDAVLVYLHGGAYVVCSARSTVNVAAAMADAAGMRVVSIDYTVAPGGRWRQVSDEVCRAVMALVAAGTPLDRIALWGDS